MTQLKNISATSQITHHAAPPFVIHSISNPETTDEPTCLGQVLTGCVVKRQALSEVTPNSPPALSSDFLLIMDHIRLHMEAKVVQAGSLVPLDFEWRDFADIFDDVPQGEARLAVFRSLNIWYRTIYVRKLHSEKQWREFYEDDTKLTRLQEVSFFENMRSGSAYSARWRDLFLHRNEALVGWAVKFYSGKFDGMIDWDRRNQELPTERELLLSAGYKGLEKAVDHFDPSRGFKFSTPAVLWIKGEITKVFKKSKAQLLERLATDTSQALMYEPSNGPRLAEDYLELRSAVEQALARLGDPRKSQIITQRYGLFGSDEVTKLAAIGTALDVSVSPQRVHAILKASLAQLKKDHELRLFYMGWFDKW